MNFPAKENTVTPVEQVEYILTECFIALGQHVGERVVSPEAAAFWRDRYRERFLITLSRNRPRAWAEDRANVLTKAASLGRKAAEFADAERTPVITELHARRASEANDCRPRSRYGMFSIWCIPPGIGDADRTPAELSTYESVLMKTGLASAD
jgi:hypothetical protein